MTKAEEHVIKNLVKIDGVEFITKQDALKAVTMEHNEVVDSFIMIAFLSLMVLIIGNLMSLM